MKSLIDTVFTWIVGGVAALAFSASALLDQLPTLTGFSSTMWLLAALAVLIITVLGLMAFMAMHEANHDDICRTANQSQIDRDVKRIQAAVPEPLQPWQKHVAAHLFGRTHYEPTRSSHQAPPERPPAVAVLPGGNVVKLPTHHRIDADLVQRLARAAAAHDWRTGDSTPNPHQRASRAHAVWHMAYGSQLAELKHMAPMSARQEAGK